MSFTSIETAHRMAAVEKKRKEGGDVMGTLTLRDYFATGAVQNFGDQIGCQSDQEWFDKVAEGAYRMADAMMEARNAK